MKEVNIISKVVGRSGAEASPSSAIMPNMSGYATKTELNTLRNEFKDFLEGADADVIINKWQDLVSFLEGISEDFDLLSMLGLKADKSELSNYVTIATEQTISAHKDFLDGLSIGGLPITKPQDDVIYLDANLVVRGGITMFGTNSVNVPTIMDAIATDGVNLKVVDGVLTFVGSSGGGLTEVYWDDVIGKPTLLSSFIDDIGYLQKSGGQMTGGIGYTLTPDSYEIGLPAAGTIDSLVGLDKLNSYKSFFGSVHLSDDWYYALSIRHRNGRDDGNKYGLLLYTTFSQLGNLEWNRQENGNWQGARVILDSVNWSQYVTAADGGNYLPLSGGTLTGSLSNILVVKGIGAYSGWKSPIQALAPDIQTGGHINIEIGKASTTRNIAWLGFKYDSDGSNNNLLTMGLHSVDDALVINGYGYVGIGTLNPKSRCDINGKLTIRTETSDNLVSSIDMKNTDTDLWQLSARYTTSENGYFKMYYYNGSTWATPFSLSRYGELLVNGGITMYSDIRKKTKLQDVELSLKQIADAPLIEHYYNSDTNKTTHVGSIAQYWASMNDWFCKLDSEGYYTMEIQNAALASAISIARELVKYESKTDKEIRMLKDEVKRLKKEIKILKSA